MICVSIWNLDSCPSFPFFLWFTLSLVSLARIVHSLCTGILLITSLVFRVHSIVNVTYTPLFLLYFLFRALKEPQWNCKVISSIQHYMSCLFQEWHLLYAVALGGYFTPPFGVFASLIEKNRPMTPLVRK